MIIIIINISAIDLTVEGGVPFVVKELKFVVLCGYETFYLKRVLILPRSDLKDKEVLLSLVR